MEEQLDVVQQAYELVVNFAVTYSFQLLGAVLVLMAGFIVGEIHRNSEANRIVEGQVGIAYDSDPEAAIKIIRGCLSVIDGVAGDPQPQIGINSFGDSSINIDYRIWVATHRYFELLHRCNLAVFKALKDNGVVIPFPQREVRMLG